jgi:predicted secreted protein
VSIFFTGLTFILLWWFTVFVLLPIGVRPNDTPGEYEDEGAPEKPFWKKKIVIAAVISALLTYIIFRLVSEGTVNLRPGL